jgi:signal transduction histidine kinase
MTICPNCARISAKPSRSHQPAEQCGQVTPEGGNITVEAHVDGTGEFVIRVSDTGIGIKRENIDKVMAPFGQVESGMTRSYEGTGLGLTLTKALMEEHGGRLEIVSKAGDGPTGTMVSAIFPANRVIPA